MRRFRLESNEMPLIDYQSDAKMLPHDFVVPNTDIYM